MGMLDCLDDGMNCGRAGELCGFGEPEYEPNTSVEHESYGNKVCSACVGVLIGMVLFLGSFALLGWNEQRTVYTTRSLEEGEENVAEASCDYVDQRMEGKLVHLACDLKNFRKFEVPGFEENLPSFEGVFLYSDEQMYQWTEHESCTTKSDKIGGGDTRVCKYTYSQAFAPRLIDSSQFHNPSGHQNPASFPRVLEENPIWAQQLRLGAYSLSMEQIKRFTSKEALTLTKGGNYTYSGSPPDTLNSDTTRVGGQGNTQLFTQREGSSTQTGDMIIRFFGSTARSASVLAELRGTSFEPWETAYKNYDIDILMEGKHSADDMFQTAKENNRALAWILRFVGWLVMFIGLQLIVGPLTVLPDIVPCIGPFLGDLIGCALCCVNFLISSALSLLTIAIAWLIFRPWIGIPLLIGALVLIGGAIFIRLYFKSVKKSKKNDANVPMYPV
mmetsp:Transcript_53039/g.103771  ORF Transcript_53039/g.103771 Transcript_53039/m.103771 type:complete len:444 (-) Transcript_53039:281-1612(-)